MKKLHLLILVSAPLLGIATGVRASDDMPGMPGMSGHEHHGNGSMLTDAQKQFLSGYEGVRAALAADDLAAAKSAAATIANSPTADGLAKAPSLNIARVAFKKLSGYAVQLAAGQTGYYVFNCPMAESDWVQVTKEIGNPYLGQKGVSCGKLKN